MKKIKLVIAALLLSNIAVKAQINLVGASVNPNGTIDIVKWQALDSSSVNRYPSGLEAYLYSSSVFDAYNSNYYLGGISSGAGVLLSFNTNSNTPSFISNAPLSNISEIDMSTGKIYNLSSDTVGFISVNEYDIYTGEETILGTISEPGVNGIITDALSIDANNGILYYVGYDNSQASCLYAIAVREPVFTWTKTTLLTTAAQNNFSSVHYDNVNNILFALNAEYNTGGNYNGSKVVEINKLSGEVIERGLLSGFPYYLGGSSSFDQNSGSFLVVAFDTAFNEQMIVFNTLNNTYITGYVPTMVSEIVCDNYSFAQKTYITTGMVDAEKIDFNVFPNPSTSKFTITISDFEGSCILKIQDMSGREYLTKQIEHPKTEISTNSLKKGVYVVSILGDKNTSTKKLIIQ